MAEYNIPGFDFDAYEKEHANGGMTQTPTSPGAEEQSANNVPWWRSEGNDPHEQIRIQIENGGDFSQDDLRQMTGREFNAYREAKKRADFAAQGIDPDEGIAAEREGRERLISLRQRQENLMREQLQYVIDNTKDDNSQDGAIHRDAQRRLDRLNSLDMTRFDDDTLNLSMAGVAEMHKKVADRRGHASVFWDALKRGYTGTAIMAAQGWLGLTDGESPETQETMRNLQSVGEELDAANPKKVGSVSEIGGVGDVIDFISEAIGENAYRMAIGTGAAIASGGAAGLLGAGAAGATAAAMAGSSLSTMALNTGEAAQDQIEEGVPFSRGWMLAQGVGYSVLDGAFGIEAGLGKLAVKTGLRTAKDTALAGLKEVGKMATKKGALKTFAKGVAGEAIQEPAQSQLVGRGRRWAQTGSPLREGETVGQAWMEALDEAAGGAAAALGMGAGGAAISHANARRIVGIHNRVVNAVKKDAAFNELPPTEQLLVAKKLMNDMLIESDGILSGESKAALVRENEDIEADLGREDADNATRAANAVLRGFDLTFAKEDFSDTVATAKSKGFKNRVDWQKMRDSATDIGEVPGGYRGVRYTDPATGLGIVRRFDKDGRTVDFIVENNLGLKDSLTGDALHTKSLEKALEACGDLDVYNQYRSQKSAAKRQVITDMFRRMYGERGANLVVADSIAAIQDQNIRAKFAASFNPETGEFARAAYEANDNTVYVLADQIKNLGQLYTDLAHERSHEDIAEFILGKSGGAETDEDRQRLAEGRERRFATKGDREAYRKWMRSVLEEKNSRRKKSERVSGEELDRQADEAAKSISQEKLAEWSEENAVERMSVNEVLKAVRDSNYSLPGAVAAWVKEKIAGDTGYALDSISDADVREELKFLANHGYLGIHAEVLGGVREDTDAAALSDRQSQSASDANEMADDEARRKEGERKAVADKARGKEARKEQGREVARILAEDGKPESVPPIEAAQEERPDRGADMEAAMNEAETKKRKENKDETGNVRDEKPAQPEQGEVVEPPAGEAAKPVEGAEARSEAPAQDNGAVEQPKAAPPQTREKPPVSAKPEAKPTTPAEPAKPVEAASRASDAKPAAKRKPTEKERVAAKKAEVAAIKEGRRNLAASPNAKQSGGQTIYTPADGGKPFSVGKKAFTHGFRGANRADNAVVSRHIGEVLDGSKALPERSGDAHFRMAKVEIGGETAHVLFTITDKGELESVDVLKGLNTKRKPAGTRSDAVAKGSEAASSLRVVEESISNLDAVWQERFKPGIEEHNKNVGRKTKWTRTVSAAPAVEKKTRRGANLRGLSYEDYGEETGDVIGAQLLRHARERDGLLRIPSKGSPDPMADWINDFLDGNARKNRRGEFIALFGMKSKRGGNDTMTEDMPLELKAVVDGMIENRGHEVVADWFLDIRRKYAEWAEDKRERQRTEKGLPEGLTLDEIEARDEADAEYDNALAEVERYEAGTPTIQNFSRERMNELKRGDVLRFDHADASWDVVGYDADADVVTLVPQGALDNPLMSDGEIAAEMVKYRVSENGFEEVKDGRKDERGASENRTGDAQGSAVRKGAGEKGGEGDFALDGGTAEEIRAEEKRRRERAEVRRRQSAPLKGGTGEVGQSLFDLGGAEGEDLFNRTARTEEEKTAAATEEGLLDPEITALPGGKFRYRGQTYRTRAAAEKALAHERTVFRQGDTVSLEQDGERVTGTVSRAPDGSLSVRVREKVARSAANPDGVKVRDVPVKDRKNLTKLIDSGTRFKSAPSAVTPEEDATYMDAVKRGDMETVRRMVREAAKRAMPGAKEIHIDWAYREDDGSRPRDRISPFEVGSMPKALSREIASWDYISKSPLSNSFYNMPGKTWDNTPDGIIRVSDHWNFTNRRHRGIHCRTDVDVDNNEEWVMARYDAKSGVYKVLKRWPLNDRKRYATTKTGRQLEQADALMDAQVKSASSISGEAMDEAMKNAVVFFDPKAGTIKSLDPVTYDDAGNVIPLSQRFNPERDDIRFKRSVPSGVQKSAGVDYPDAGAEISGIRFKVGAKRREEYARQLAKHRPDLDANAVLDEIDKFDDPKKEKVALHWVIRGAIRLPEDAYKVEDALSVAEKAKVDPFAYKSPLELIEAHKDIKPTRKAIDPATVPELSDPRDEGDGIVSYEVADTREGQAAMRRIIDTHWGEDANPWCLLARKKKWNEAWEMMNDRDAYEAAESWWKGLSREERGKFTTDVDEEWITEAGGAEEYYFQNIVNNPASMSDAWEYWNNYSALPKRVAFKDGKLLAFMATEGMDFGYPYRGQDRLAEMFPEQAEEYERWKETEEAQENGEPGIDEWMDRNYPELLDKARNAEEWWDRKDESHPDLDWARGRNDGIRFKRNAAFEHSLDALQSIADGADYGVLHNAKYGEIRYPKGRTGKGGMGFMHIVQNRMEKDGATIDEAIDTAIKVGQAVEIGEETAERLNTRHFDYDGVRAIVAWRENDKAVITGYEINEGDSAAAVRRAEELAPRPHVSSEEVAQRLRDRISNLRAESQEGIRFKRAASVDDPDVLFGAKASYVAHGAREYTPEELGLPPMTAEGVVASAHRKGRDTSYVQNLMHDVLTNAQRTVEIDDVAALAVRFRDCQDALNDVVRRQAESSNPDALKAERELYESLCDKIAETSQKIGRRTGQILRSFQYGVGADVRDTEAYILQSIRAERRRQGAEPDDAADRETAKRMAGQIKKLNDEIEALRSQIADLQANAVTKRRAEEGVNKARREAKSRTLSPERRAKAEAATGVTFSDNNAAGFAKLESIFGKALSFKGGNAETGNVLTDEMAQGFSALLEGHSFDEIENVIKSQMPKAASAWAEFRRQNEKKSAAELAELAQPVTGSRLVTTKDLAAAREEAKRRLDENAGDPRAQRIALGHYLRRYRDALINENPDIPMDELNEKMAAEATALTGAEHDAVAMLAVSAGVDGYDLETRAEIQRKIAKAQHALNLFRQGKVNEAAKESGLLYEDEATALKDMEDELNRLIKEKADEIDVLSTFSEKNAEAVERIRRLKDEIKEMNGVLSLMRREASLAERKTKYAEVLEKRLAEAQRNADNLLGEIDSDEFKERKARAEAKIAELKAALAVARRDEATLKRIQDKLSEYERRIADGDYDRALQTYRANDAELQSKLRLARERRNNLRRKLEAERRTRKYREMGIVGKTLYGLGGILGEMKSVVASFDLSSVLRQGGQLTWAHPFIAAKNLRETIKAFKNEEYADKLMAQIRQRPNWQYYEKAGIDFTDWGEGAQNKEDVYLLNQYRRITNMKFLKAGVQMSERAFSMFLNLMRADVFDAMANGSTFGGASNMNDSQLKALGRFINIASQRGAFEKGGKFSNAIPMLNTFLWSPRNVASRFQFLYETARLLGGGAAYGDKTLRTLFAKELVRYIGGMSAAAMFLKAIAGLFRDDDDPPDETEFDPRSSDFLKVRFGNIRMDLMSGLTPIIVFGSRMLSGKTKNLRGQVRESNRYELTGRFLRQKFAPGASIVYDMGIAREDFERRDIDWGSVWEKDAERISAYRYLLGSFAPLSGADLLEQADVGGLPKTFVTGALSLLGANVQAFDPYNYKQLKGDYTYFRGLYDKATDPEERRHILEYHPMLKRRERIEAVLKQVRDLEKVKKNAEKSGQSRPDLDERIKAAKERAIGVMAGLD